MRIIAIILLGASLAAPGCSRSEKSAPPASSAPTAKDPALAKAAIAKGAVVIDVRTPEEFGDGHVPNATNIAVGEIGNRLAEVDKLVGGDKTKPVVVYCAAGKRAAKAKQVLEDAGYQTVVNGGGYDDLQ